MPEDEKPKKVFNDSDIKSIIAVHGSEIEQIQNELNNLKQEYDDWVDKYYEKHSVVTDKLRELDTRMASLLDKIEKEQQERNERLKNTFTIVSIVIVVINVVFAIIDHIISG